MTLYSLINLSTTCFKYVLTVHYTNPTILSNQNYFLRQRAFESYFCLSFFLFYLIAVSLIKEYINISLYFTFQNKVLKVELSTA